MEKRYAPYSKWFGTAFQRLECAAELGPLFESILTAPDYATCEPSLARAYTRLAEMHNALAITPPLDPRTRTYSGWHSLRAGVEHLPPGDTRDTRPFQVIFAGRFTDALAAEIKDPQVVAFPRFNGSVNQFLVESSDAVQNVQFCRSLVKVLG